MLMPIVRTSLSIKVSNNQKCRWVWLLFWDKKIITMLTCPTYQTVCQFEFISATSIWLQCLLKARSSSQPFWPFSCLYWIDVWKCTRTNFPYSIMGEWTFVQCSLLLFPDNLKINYAIITSFLFHGGTKDLAEFIAMNAALSTVSEWLYL